MAKNKNKSKSKTPLLHKPVGFAISWAGGALAGLAFRKAWMVIRHEEEAPDPLDPDRGWGEILLAAAMQGAIFAVARSVVDRTRAKTVARSTGTWPHPGAAPAKR
ncbi:MULTISPECIES: DUF4235 domain-containing protein [unclassified Streptomyces]|uniref:DUF4235 domain-containing protein n=1 Tax=unclassified Streptomyces TaxID=2593676 RepID=UPI002E805D91|nr:DUF4235 domain-containing protein [Streptomyces sp. NBC_00566]WUB85431.1 DUF4235 domain-containing protein [Streptomyces sp. NBC_00566]